MAIWSPWVGFPASQPPNLPASQPSSRSYSEVSQAPLGPGDGRVTSNPIPSLALPLKGRECVNVRPCPISLPPGQGCGKSANHSEVLQAPLEPGVGHATRAKVGDLESLGWLPNLPASQPSSRSYWEVSQAPSGPGDRRATWAIASDFGF